MAKLGYFMLIARPTINQPGSLLMFSIPKPFCSFHCDIQTSNVTTFVVDLPLEMGFYQPSSCGDIWSQSNPFIAL